MTALRDAGYEVYDFRDPAPGATGFSWADIDPGWLEWTARRFRDSLDDPRIVRGFELDMTALQACDALVMVQPCGRSAALELGWAAGAGKPTIVLLSDGEPELMLKMAQHFCLDVEDVIETLKRIEG